MNNAFFSIPDAIEHIKKGKMLIILDDERELEADFFLPAQSITPEHIMTMVRYGSGLLCVAITQEQANRLHIPLMVSPQKNTEATKLNLTVSVNAKNGITTGISAFDRAKTIQVLADPNATTDDTTIPGHIFGVIAKSGALLT